MKKILFFITLAIAILTSCQDSPKADLVVYGKIYTAEDNQIVEAKPAATYFEGKKVYALQ